MSDRSSSAESAHRGHSSTPSQSPRSQGRDEIDWVWHGQATNLGESEDSSSPHLPGSSQGATPDMEDKTLTAEGNSPLPVGVPTTAPLYSIGSITSSAVGGDHGYDYGHGRPSVAPDRNDRPSWKSAGNDRNDLSASEGSDEGGSAIGGTSSHTHYIYTSNGRFAVDREFEYIELVS